MIDNYPDICKPEKKETCLNNGQIPIKDPKNLPAINAATNACSLKAGQEAHAAIHGIKCENLPG
jgi:hypothetical protein